MSVCHNPECLVLHTQPVKTACTCKCHVSQSECCDNCDRTWFTVDGKKCELGETFVMTYPKTSKEETIKIKKALWDEMLESKATLDELVDQIKEMARVINYNEQAMIKLENKIADRQWYIDNIHRQEEAIQELYQHKSRQIDENRAISKAFDQLQERIIELERFQDITYLQYKKIHKLTKEQQQ